MISCPRAFVPSHITGFFAAKRQEDPLRSGSIGCGVNLSLGAVTTVVPADEVEVFINGELSEAPVSMHVISAMAQSPVRVYTELQMPLGAGFGASGAGALGCAYALNALFNLGLTSNQAGAVAHVAEVTNITGLGDVMAQNTGGLVIRLHPGGPGLGVVDKIPVSPLVVSYAVRGPLSTRDVLSDPKAMKAVNLAGEDALKAILKRPTLEEFMAQSKKFTIQTGLASDWALDAIEAVEAAGGMASMIMLGDSVFAINAKNALDEFSGAGSTYISQKGANLD